uniref:Dipeptidyl peptidase like 10 n=1 Tax=Myripristis murdjan TaxID=586833 RepID=A0A667Y9D6_9TELE
MYVCVCVYVLKCVHECVFSQSFTASYAIYNVANGDLVELNPPEREKEVLQYAAWGPQGNQLAYVFEGSIYYKPGVASQAVSLTHTGLEQQVVNGISDWTYEEEVLLTYAAHWWSSDGARLAYLTINNSATPMMEIPYFLGGLYPSNAFFPYPKAGSSIPSVSLFVVNLYGPAHTLEMIPPDSIRARYYISMVTWVSSTRLAVRWLNRAQNQSVLCVCEATTGACSEKHKMDPCLLFQQEVPLFTADGSVFYMILPAKQGARGEFHHIASLSPAIPSVPPRFLTSGNWDVTLLCALDEKAGKMYVRATVCGAVYSHPSALYQLTRQCLSCNLLDGCSFFKTEFSPNQTHFTLYCLGPGIPKVTVHSTKDPSSECYIFLEDNSALAEALEDKRLPETLFRTLSLILLLLSHRDGVPGSQSVTEEFALDWTQVLASTHDVALAWVDGRSGVGRGQKTSAVDPRKLGAWLMQLPYIDDRRIALYGKAFGGYLTLKMLAATDNLFQCTAAVAPITDFRLYSAAFSERFLGLPAKEEHTYSDVNKLKDENFLVLHGTADARVHFQQSAELLNRLVKVEANYSLQLYPDEGHILREPRSIQHFQRTLVNYLQTCLRHSLFLDPIEEEEEEDD